MAWNAYRAPEITMLHLKRQLLVFSQLFFFLNSLNQALHVWDVSKIAWKVISKTGSSVLCVVPIVSAGTAPSPWHETGYSRGFNITYSVYFLYVKHKTLEPLQMYKGNVFRIPDITEYVFSVLFSTNNYRLIIYPLAVSPVSQAWFAVSVAPLSYSGFPVAFIAKDPSTPFLLPDILDGTYVSVTGSCRRWPVLRGIIHLIASPGTDQSDYFWYAKETFWYSNPET